MILGEFKLNDEQWLVHLDIWAGYEAAHVFPLEYEQWWNEQGFGTCISDMDNTAWCIQNQLRTERNVDDSKPTQTLRPVSFYHQS